jgi:hypothetical protein
VTRLEQERDSLGARMSVRLERLRAVLAAPGQAGEPGRLLEAVRPIFAEARADVVATHEAIRQILTSAQWDRLPESIRNLALRVPGTGRQNR